ATLRAVASPLPLPAVFASFVLASVVSTLAWVPGGLGTFEASAVALLHLQGASVESALAATLLLRALTFWVPMLPGVVLAHRETARRPGREVSRAC
ncbi:MAG TPA: lysylphosphatidylglycerol synthase domain-containing protein, partial [Myxococcota bacterium]|nr:lysylphosphatidylglycerol synthase domain-containing protein [Myxococcota bacterium]